MVQLTDEVPLLTRREAANFLKVSVRWLDGNPDVPRLNLARSDAKRALVRYRVADLMAYAVGR